MSSILSARNQYTPDGQMKWGRFPLLLLPLPGGLLTGMLLTFLFHVGWYLIVLASLFAGGLLALSMWLAVRWAACRIPWLAGLVGLFAGVIAYSSYFYFDMVVQIGPNAAVHPELLPDYIQFRMENDVQEDVGGGVPNRNPPKPSVFMNWLTFVYESLIIIVMAVECGRRTAWRAHDAELDCWMKREEVRLQPGARDALTAALEGGDLNQFLDAYRPIAAPNNTQVCTVTIEYADFGDTSPLERPVYLSAVEAPLRTALKGVFGRSGLFLQVELTAQEALRLQPLFSKFSDAIMARHEELAEVSQAPGVSHEMADAVAVSDARIEELPESQRVNIFRGRHLLMANLCGAMPIGLILGGALIGFLATLPGTIIAGVLIGIPAGLLVIAGILIALCCPHAAETSYAVRVLRRHFAERSGCVVNAESPDNFHVALTVRENWQKVKMETASDAGFAEIDESAQQINMECDAERFEIPFSSIISADSERFMMPIDQNSEYWYTRLVVKIPEGTREILLCDASPVWGLWTSSKRRRRTEEISQQLAPVVN